MVHVRRLKSFISPSVALRRRGLGAPHTHRHRRAHRSRSLARRTNRKRSSRAAPFASPHALDSNDGHLRHPGGCRPRGRLLPEGARGISAPLQAARRPQARYAIAPRPPSRASNPRTFGFAPIEALNRVAPAPAPIRRPSAPAASHGGEAGSANEIALAASIVPPRPRSRPREPFVNPDLRPPHGSFPSPPRRRRRQALHPPRRRCVHPGQALRRHPQAGLRLGQPRVRSRGDVLHVPHRVRHRRRVDQGRGDPVR